MPTIRRSAIMLTLAALELTAAAAAPALARVSPTVYADGGTMSLDKTGAFCLTEYRTGSHIPQVTCKSQADWAKEGLIVTLK